MTDTPESTTFLKLTADIVSAFVSKNHIPAGELPALMETVNASLGSLTTGTIVEPPPQAIQPAVPVKKSVTDAFIICLEDGKKFKSLKRHLRTSYNMSPQEYRAKWGLKADYPMVAPAYAAERSKLAKASGLGQLRQKAAAVVTTPPAPAVQVKKTRGRPKKVAA